MWAVDMLRRESRKSVAVGRGPDGRDRLGAVSARRGRNQRLSTPKSLAPCGIERVLGGYERLQSHPALIPDESPLVRGESYECPLSRPSLRTCCQPNLAARYETLRRSSHRQSAWPRSRAASFAEIATPGLSLDTIRDQIASGGAGFNIEQAAGTGGFLPLARLTLRHLDPSSDDVAFDPTLHSDPEVQLTPRCSALFAVRPTGAAGKAATPNSGHAVGSSLDSSTSGVFSRVAIPPSPPSSVGPGRPPLGSSAPSSS